MLDLGTGNETLRQDPLYLGERCARLEGDAYYEVVDAFIRAVHSRWPEALIQFEDFLTPNAYKLLHRYRDKILCFKPHLMVFSRYGVVEAEEQACRLIESLDGIVSAAPSIETRVLIRSGGRTAAPIVVGVDPTRAGKVSRVGEHMTNGTFSIEGEQAVIGSDLARRLDAQPGSKILVYSPLNVIKRDELYLPEELTVAGIFLIVLS